MKPTTLLEIANTLYSQLDGSDKTNADLAKNGKYVGYLTNGKYKSALTPIEKYDPRINIYNDIGANIGELIRAANAEILAEEIKKSGSSSRSKIIKEMLKQAAKNYSVRNMFHSTYIHNGKQYVVDEHRIFVFAEPCMDVPIGEDTENKQKVISLCDKNLTIRNYATEKLSRPDLAKLKAYIKRKTAENKVAGITDYKSVKYCFGNITVNAKYLVDLLEAFPEAELFYTGKALLALYARDENGNEGYIMPIKDDIMVETVL